MGSISTEPNYAIPEKYRSLLEIVDVVDSRPEDEILQQLSQHVPVTSEKNMWAFWDTGLMNSKLSITMRIGDDA